MVHARQAGVFRGSILVFVGVATVVLPAGCAKSEDTDKAGQATSQNDDDTTGAAAPPGRDRPAADSGIINEDIYDACGTELWKGPGEERRPYSCRPAEEPEGESKVRYECGCAGESLSSQESSCSAALLDACGIEIKPPTFCVGGRTDGTTCWQDPKREGTHVCQCADNPGDIVSVDSAKCEAAMFLACASPCKTGENYCEPGSKVFTFNCFALDQDMDAAAGPWVTVPAAWCDEAQSAAFSPACTSEKGECFERTGNGYDCSCADELQTTAISYAQADSCGAALALHCGAPPKPKTISCEQESSNGLVHGECTLRQSGSYSCQCFEGNARPSGTDGSGSAIPFTAKYCETLLKQNCPDAFD